MVRALKACERELKNFPEMIRVALADLLFRIDRGEFIRFPASRPMPSIGPRVHELRLHDESGEYRVIYWIKEHERIFLLHAFKKTTRATLKHNMFVAKMRLGGIL